MIWTESTPLSPENLNNMESRISSALADVNTGKTNLYNALVAKGVTPGTQAFADLVTAINSMLVPSGNANPEDVATGKTFSKAGQVGLTGTAMRMATGTGSLTQVSSTSARLVVTGLTFMPSKIYLKGSVRARYTDSVYPEGDSQNFATITYSVFESQMMPIVGSFWYVVMPTYESGSSNRSVNITITASITYQSNGFTVIFTQTEPSTRAMDQYGTQSWVAVG